MKLDRFHKSNKLLALLDHQASALALAREAIEVIEPVDEFIDNELGWCLVCRWCNNVIKSESYGVSVEGHASNCRRKQALDAIIYLDEYTTYCNIDPKNHNLSFESWLYFRLLPEEYEEENKK